jgi:ribosomal protein S4
MKYPGYLLNPGDMFQVDVGKVMFATGARKESTKAKSVESDAEDEDSKAVAEGPDGAEKVSGDNEAVEKDEEAEIEEDPRQVLKGLLEQSKSILSSPRQKDMGAKRKQDLRAFQKSVKRTLSRSKSATILTDSLETQFLELQHQLGISPDASQLPLDHEEVSNISSQAAVPKSMPSTSFEDQDSIPTPPEQNRSTSDSSGLSSLDLTDLKMALELLRENPIDPSKPYATPWQPREYMSAFAFIPRYLEVNHNICAAVYLRHPVARPGLAEVPTPFSEGTSREGFGWYLRRR